MKKTLTANISGTVFHIEEDAYEALQRYLTSIRSQFAGSPGEDEIMGDIEARIAELFTERLVGRGQVVSMSDVEHIVSVMGQPEDYLGDDEHEPAASAGSSAGPSGQQRKRLFRDLEDRWVGGVLSGLATYFGTDPLWLRIAFIALLVLGVGSPVLIYIILWILVPPANTAAERLMMEGEPVTVDNLRKAFEEGGARMAQEVEGLGKRFNKEGFKRYSKDFGKGASTAARGASRAFAVIVGLVIFLVGVSLGISLLGTLVGGSVFAMDGFAGERSIGIVELGDIIFPSSSQAAWFALAMFLLFLIPVVGLISGGLQLMLGLRAPTWLRWILIPVWITAIFVVTFIGIRVGRDFQRTETLSTVVTMAPVEGQILYLTGMGEMPDTKDWSINFNGGRIENDLEALRTSADSIYGAWAGLDVRRSPDADFHVRIDRNSQGVNRKSSLRRSEHIQHHMVQQDSTMAFSPWFAFPREDKLRAQRLRFVVLVPIGKAVHISTELGSMLDDVKNVTNTLDSEMAGRTWTMTPNGLSSSVHPDNVPDQLFPAKPEAPSIPEPKSTNSEGGKIIQASQGLLLPDLFKLLRYDH